MLDPLVQIPGCRLSNKIGNHPDHVPEPGKTIHVRLGSLARCEAVAELYAYIAYPDPLDANEREKFSIAMARWAVGERGLLEPEWKECTNMKPSIRPMVFSQPEQLFLQVYLRGSKILYRRLVIAGMMLLPHLLEEEIGGLSPTVGNIAVAAAAKLGYSAESKKTVESKVWAPVKSVAHVAAAATLFHSTLDWPLGGLWNDGEHPLCVRQPMLATLFYDDVVRKMLPVAELFRAQLPSCNRFRIRAEDTVRFVAEPRLS